MCCVWTADSSLTIDHPLEDKAFQGYQSAPVSSYPRNSVYRAHRKWYQAGIYTFPPGAAELRLADMDGGVEQHRDIGSMSRADNIDPWSVSGRNS